MPIKVQPVDQTKPQYKMLVGDFKARKARAYQYGSQAMQFAPEYEFEREYYDKGYSDYLRIKEEIKRGER